MYSTTRTTMAWAGSGSSPAAAAAMSCCRRRPRIVGLISTDRKEPSGSHASTGSRRLAETRHSSAAPVATACCQAW